MRFSDQIMRKNSNKGCCEFYVGFGWQRQNGKTIDYICYVLPLLSHEAQVLEPLGLRLIMKLPVSFASHVELISAHYIIEVRPH